ncbi:MAG: serine/threonine-protein kinase [Enhygromyxa sp.]
MHYLPRPPAELDEFEIDPDELDLVIDEDSSIAWRAPRRSKEATFADLASLAADPAGAVLVAGRYRVERALGHGGMASVYAAHDLDEDRPVALKILSEDGCASPPLRARFLREARLHGRVHHPNVVEVLDFGSTSSGVIYLVMELLVGEDLGRTLARRRTLPWPRVRELMLEICAGLGAAHAVGVVHRDLKPSNCFKVALDGRERVRLVDFGIATAIDEAPSERLTLREQIIGTPEYMSPEQARGEAVDHRSDIYAAGLLLGQMLTGALPFRAATSTAMLAAQIYEPPPKLGSLLPPGVHVPAALERVYERALAKQPERRFANVDELAAALRSIDPGGPVLVSGAYERGPASSRLALETTTRPRPRERPALEPSWPLCATAASIGLVVGALGALLLASKLGPAAVTPLSVDADSGSTDSSAGVEVGLEDTPLQLIN